MNNEIIKKVKAFGNSGHVVLPAALIGMEVKIMVQKETELQKMLKKQKLKDNMTFEEEHKLNKEVVKKVFNDD